MAEFYKIERTDLVVFIKYNPEDGTMVQLTGNNITMSRGTIFGWQDSSKEEFDRELQKLTKKLQEYLNK
jgi:ABC-type uncharacterized transport system ATPase component